MTEKKETNLVITVGVALLAGVTRADKIQQGSEQGATTMSSILTQDAGAGPTRTEVDIDHATTQASLPTDTFGGILHEERDGGGSLVQSSLDATTRLTTTLRIVSTRYVYHTIAPTTATEVDDSDTSDNDMTAPSSNEMSLAASTETQTADKTISTISPSSTDLAEILYCPMSGSSDVYTLCDAYQRTMSQATPTARVISSGSSVLSSSVTLKVFRGAARVYRALQGVPACLLSPVKLRTC